jgi:arginyl-tRNA synthetase
MNFISLIQQEVASAVKALYGLDVAAADVICSPTRKEFEGDYTITVFSFAKSARKAPPQIGQELGDYLTQNVASIAKFNVIQGFLNLVVDNVFWTDFVAQNALNQSFGLLPKKGTRVMVEYSSPNTNKPLHLGHIRNILLGWSCSKILEAAGYDVVRTKVVNDRGIAICKSMIAWQLFGEGKTPDTEGVKGDHFVGDYYVMFEGKFKEEYKIWQEEVSLDEEVLAGINKKNLQKEEFFKEFKNDYFNKHSALGAQAREMLLKWESGDKDTIDLWKTMNNWVYAGFNETYKSLGVHFDKIYYESNSYLLGKDIIEDGLKREIFYQKPDSSVWIDLSDVKLDQKLVLRSDGTSVYITQDIGMARVREAEFAARKVVYVVADEQNYHFQVLFEILKKLGEPYADGLHHLSYGMVELPTGKMKSREGTVVDADDLIAEVIKEANREVTERGALEGVEAATKAEIERRIGVGAMKYQLIKVNPKKKMVFDPKESVDFEGHTGPYIQYAFVRSSGVVRDALAKNIDLSQKSNYTDLKPEEKDLIQRMYELPKNIEEAASNYDPSVLANFCYELAKSYNRFWYHCSILKENDPDIRLFRLQSSQLVATSLQRAMDLLGIEMPERM